MKRFYTFIVLIFFSLSIKAQDAIDFTFTDIHGDQHQLQNALDQGFIVFLDFFFVDCPPCQATAPDVQQIHEDFQGKNVIIWSISDRDSDAYIEQYKSGAGLTYISGGVAGGGNTVIQTYAQDFSFVGFPTFAIVCPDGGITWDIWPVSNGMPEVRSAIEACGVTDSDPYQPLNTTSIELVSETVSSIDLHPNPASSFSNLYLTLEDNVHLNIVLYNLLGQEVSTIANGYYPTGSNYFPVDLTQLNSGTYIIQIVSDTEQLKTLKLIHK